MRPIDFDAPWLVERSRAMHADLDAAPSGDAAREAIREMHINAALAEHQDIADDVLGRGRMRSGLLVAGPLADNPPSPAQWEAWLARFALPETP